MIEGCQTLQVFWKFFCDAMYKMAKPKMAGVGKSVLRSSYPQFSNILNLSPIQTRGMKELGKLPVQTI